MNIVHPVSVGCISDTTDTLQSILSQDVFYSVFSGFGYLMVPT